MSDSPSSVCFFLGANSPQGFVSRFDELDSHRDDWHTFIIKGGPGSGKSTLMRRIAAAFREESPSMELIPCSSDAASLDAVILPEWHASVVDGTAPHVLDATYPAVNQTLVPLGELLDPLALRPHGPAIREIIRGSSQNYLQAIRYLDAANAFLANSTAIGLSCTNTRKLQAYVRRFASRHLPRVQGADGASAVERRRFLSSISCDGLTLLGETAASLCPQLYLLQDDAGAVSHLFLSCLRDHALELGQPVITCYCPMDPLARIDHLLFPAAGFGVLTQNRFHDLSAVIPVRRIHAKRFMDQQALAAQKKRLSYNRKAAAQLIGQAVETLRGVKARHDELEGYYQQSMDFSGIDPIFLKIEGQIRQLRQMER